MGCFEYLKYQLVNFKVDMCCWMVPVRVGLLVVAYLTIISQVLSLVGLSDDTFASLVMYVLEAILDDYAKKTIPVLAHTCDLAFTVILLCAIYRKDISLMRLYQRYSICAVILSVLVYSMIVAALGVLLGIVLVMDIVFQLYVLVLLRSMIVEMKLEKKNLELPTVVMSTLITEPKEVKTDHDVEAASESDESEGKPETGEQKDKLETVDEQSKEESSNEEERKEKKQQAL